MKILESFQTCIIFFLLWNSVFSPHNESWRSDWDWGLLWFRRSSQVKALQGLSKSPLTFIHERFSAFVPLSEWTCGLGPPRVSNIIMKNSWHHGPFVQKGGNLKNRTVAICSFCLSFFEEEVSSSITSPASDQYGPSNQLPHSIKPL